MLKKIIKAITLVSLPLAFTVPSHAVANYVSLSCPETAATGESTSCKITGHSTSSISGVAIKISADNLQVTNVSTAPSWYGDANNGQIVITTEENKTGDFDIGTISIQPSSAGLRGTISLSNIIFSNNTFFEFSVGNTDASISTVAGTKVTPKEDEEKEKEPVADLVSLKSIEIAGYSIDFAKDKYTYNLHIPETVKSLDITVLPEVEESVVTITGNENLTNDSVIKITVENGDQKSVYRIKIIPDIAASTTPKTDYTNLIIIGIICVCVIAIGIVSVLLFIRKKKSSTQKNLTSQPPAFQSANDSKENPFIHKSTDSSNPLPQKPQTPPQPNPTTPPSPQPPTNPDNSSISKLSLTSVPNPPVQAQPSPKPAQPTSQPQPQPAPLPNIPKSTRPISLDQIPFEQPIPAQTKKPTTPIIFES